MIYDQMTGALDGLALIALNNVAVGFTPSNFTVIGVYPSPILLSEPLVAPSLETNSSSSVDVGPHV